MESAFVQIITKFYVPVITFCLEKSFMYKLHPERPTKELGRGRGMCGWDAKKRHIYIHGRIYHKSLSEYLRQVAVVPVCNCITQNVLCGEIMLEIRGRRKKGEVGICEKTSTYEFKRNWRKQQFVSLTLVSQKQILGKDKSWCHKNFQYTDFDCGYDTVLHIAF